MNWKDIIVEYDKIENKYDITKLHCLSCVDASLNWLKEEDNRDDYTEEERINRAQVVYDYWLDTDIQISKISDIICEHWKEYEEDEDFDIYDYMERLESE